MLPSLLRFPLREYPEFFSTAKVVRLPSFRIYLLPNHEISHRFAVVVKKAHAKATGRALTRRRVYALLQELVSKGERPFPGFYDVVIVVQGMPKDSAVYQQELESFWNTAW
jgi:ribonuclease P protein component